MYPYRLIALGAIALLLSGCYILPDDRNEAQKKVDADQRCNAMGYMLPDNADYDSCVVSERAAGYPSAASAGESSLTTPYLYSFQHEVAPYPCSGCSQEFAPGLMSGGNGLHHH